jgi:hypothetical protein
MSGFAKRLDEAKLKALTTEPIAKPAN